MDGTERSRRSVLLRLAWAGLAATSAPLWVRELAAASVHVPAATILTAHEDATVLAICERIIPETDTPGATRAGVGGYINAVLADAAPHARRKFLDGLSWMDAASRRQHGRDFICLTDAEQTALLESLSTNDPPQEAVGRQFFHAVKTLTISGYYTSEAVMREEQ